MVISMTLIIIIVTVLVSVSAFRSQKIMDDLIFYPPAITNDKQYYRFISCGLIHADFPHLIFNLISLYSFGRFVEVQFTEIWSTSGKFLYLGMYLTALIISILPSYLKHKNDYQYKSLGASGAVSAVVFAGLMIAPQVTVGFFIIPPIIPGFVFGPIFLLISAWLDRKGGGNINHSAHIYGALYGIAFLIIVGAVSGRYNAIQQFIDGVKSYLQ